MLKISSVGFIAALLCAPVAAQSQADFSGAYVGSSGGIAPYSGNHGYSAAAFAGHRLQVTEVLILGIEGNAGLGITSTGRIYSDASLLGQAGVVVGGNALLFATAGYGGRMVPTGAPAPFPTSTTEAYAVLGFGAEFAMNEVLHLRADAQMLVDQRTPACPSCSTGRGTLGIAFQLD